MTPDFSHRTVLLRETLELLAPRAGGLYCDGTVGGGGHAEGILDASGPDGRLIGIDRDPAALAAAGARLARFGDRVTLVHGRFGDALAILEGAAAKDGADGIVLDLGISSPQVDVAERGFSFMKDGPLDMRMDPTQGETAAELIRRVSVEELGNIIRDFGEDPFARPIARAIKEADAAHALTSTTQLAEVVARALPARELRSRKTDPATRTFQALRVAVNQELDDLARFLADFPAQLKVGGRIAVIAFHSLEDRLVKDRFRDLSRHPGVPADIAAEMGIRPDPVIDLSTRKPIFPSEAEVAANPRSRSARLRGAVRR